MFYNFASENVQSIYNSVFLEPTYTHIIAQIIYGKTTHKHPHVFHYRHRIRVYHTRHHISQQKPIFQFTIRSVLADDFHWYRPPSLRHKKRQQILDLEY